MHDLMIDLETLATTPDALILSIGAVFFDRDTPGKLGAEFYQRIQMDQKHGRIDHNTLSWWMERRGAWPTGDVVHLAVALRWFSRFVEECTPNKDQAVIVRDLKEGPPRLRIWGHGADFDPPILHSAYLTCGMDRPWGKGQVRDTRTLFELAGYQWKTEGPREGVHHALEDAKAAARAVQEAMRLQRQRNEVPYRAGLPSTERVRAHGRLYPSKERDGFGLWMALDQGDAHFYELAADLYQNDNGDPVLAVIDEGCGYNQDHLPLNARWRPCTPAGTPVHWSEVEQ